LLVPAGAELEQATPHPVPANFLVVDRPFDGQMRTETDVGKTVFGTLFVLERGHSIDVALSYRLPSVAVWTSRGGQYDLTIQKQSGAAPHHITVTVLWPAGYSFTHASMLPAHVETGSASFSFDLLTDQVLSLTWNR
jgi:hypothetical protein